MSLKVPQRGFSLIEVLVALLIMCIGLLGAAALQLNALKYTDGSAMRTQASFIAYDMLDRIRANNTVNYTLASTSTVSGTEDYTTPRTTDWADFKNNIVAFSPTGTGSIAVVNNVVTITINWSDTRGGKTINAFNANAVANDTSVQSFTLTSRAISNGTTTP